MAHLKTNVSVDAGAEGGPPVEKVARLNDQQERLKAPTLLRAHRLGGRDPRQRVHSLDTAQQVHEERCGSSAVAERQAYNAYS